jgi:hypothetical protein
MSPQATFPRAGILGEIVEPRGAVESPQFARVLLSLHLKEDAKERIRQLLEKKNAGTITAEEELTLEEYIVTGEFLDLLYAKARRTLRESGTMAQ